MTKRSSKRQKLELEEGSFKNSSFVENEGTKLKATETNESNTDNDLKLQTPLNSIPEQILVLEKDLGRKLKNIKFKSPVEYIYNPVEYAYDVHSKYVHSYCQNTKKILFLGINPGPWGMSQNGVPFGEISMARDWLKMSGKIEKPPREHPDRKITGFDCTRKEVSGLRFWGFFRDICEKPENFFRHSYVHNYCPLALMASNARNITPADLKTEAQQKLLDECDVVLEEIIKLLQVEIIVGIGKFAEGRGKTVAKKGNLNVKVIYMAHPSPRALNNENWPEKAKKTLQEQELLQYFTK